MQIKGYFDGSGSSTVPKVEGNGLYAADGNALFANVSWGAKEGYMALDHAQ